MVAKKTKAQNPVMPTATNPVMTPATDTKDMLSEDARVSRARIPRTVRYHGPSGRRNPFLTPFRDRESTFTLARARRYCPGSSRIEEWQGRW
jgi:hypothetical protein